MTEMSSGTALRKLEQANAGLRKSRKAMRLLRGGSSGPSQTVRDSVLAKGWGSLTLAFRLIAEIPIEAADDDVMTRQLAVQRYATALLVRLRRLARNESSAHDDDPDDDSE